MEEDQLSKEGSSRVERSTSRVRQIAMSLHERETTVRKAEAMIANHQPLQDHAASASSSSERAQSTGHPSPQHKPRNSPKKENKADDSFIKELLEIARAESQEKHKGPSVEGLLGGRTHSQQTLDELKVLDTSNMGKAPLQSSPLLKGNGGKLDGDLTAELAMRKLTEDRDSVAGEGIMQGMPEKGGELHMSMGHITDENGDRKPKDFKEAISMASNRMIRKKQPSQDMGSWETVILKVF